LPRKTIEKSTKDFNFRIKTGEQEIEIRGERSEVMKTIQELPDLMKSVQKAFDIAKPKSVATLTVRTQTAKEEAATQRQKQNYPQINSTQDCSEAILEILRSEWGKWRPRTMDELKETLQSNGINCQGKGLAKVLIDLVQKGAVRRWNTDAGFVFILAEKEALNVKDDKT
jgi:hypothetical protein